MCRAKLERIGILNFFLMVGLFFGSFVQSSFANNLNKAVSIGASKIDIQFEIKNSKGIPIDSMPLNQLVTLNIKLKKLSGPDLKALKLKSFDAVMPQHRHGMVTTARISETGFQEYLIEGVKLHMPGDWQINVQLQNENAVAQVAIPLKL